MEEFDQYREFDQGRRLSQAEWRRRRNIRLANKAPPAKARANNCGFANGIKRVPVAVISSAPAGTAFAPPPPPPPSDWSPESLPDSTACFRRPPPKPPPNPYLIRAIGTTVLPSR